MSRAFLLFLFFFPSKHKKLLKEKGWKSHLKSFWLLTKPPLAQFKNLSYLCFCSLRKDTCKFWHSCQPPSAALPFKDKNNELLLLLCALLSWSCEAYPHLWHWSPVDEPVHFHLCYMTFCFKETISTRLTWHSTCTLTFSLIATS